ncbi:MAG: LPS export ABC transporter permease LptG [Chlorobiales bacterium]|nr:LPS export ABC transporter permease LptG [Chlorobiales bacterium]
MKILDKYIARQFFSTYVFAAISFTVLFILANLIEEIGTFIDRELSVEKVILYYLRMVPETILLISPISTLLASLYVTGRMSGGSELSAMKAAGVSMKQFLIPFAAVALLITFLNIINAGWLYPETAVEKHRFEAEYFNRKFETVSGDKNLHILESRNRILSIGALDPEKETGYNISLETFDGPELVSRIDAKKITYNKTLDRWLFHETSTRIFKEKEVLFRENSGKDTLKLSMTGSSLKELGIQPDEMDIVQHFRYIEEKQKAGFSNLGRVIVKFHSKMALPFASLIIILIGVPLSAQKKRSGLALEFGISLFIGFSYLAIQRTVAIAGYRSLIDPVLAAWLPNLLFLLIGVLIYKTANK